MSAGEISKSRSAFFVAPTDAAAVAAIGGGLPRRFLTTLRAESLVNDGTALALFGVAAGVAVSSERFSAGGAALAFVVSYVGGAAAGVDPSRADRNGRVGMAIRDDGVGGADPARGSGLIGLRDRVETMGGTLRIDSRPGGGTSLLVELPNAPAQTASDDAEPIARMGAGRGDVRRRGEQAW